MNDNYRKVYQEDSNSVRYQNDLMWNRFKTAATIEGLVLFGLFQLPDLTCWETRSLMIAGFLLVFIIF